MPSAINLVVKKADGVTDITYDVVSGSGGDGSPAVFRQDTGAPAALPYGLRKVLKLWAQWNGPKTARQTKFNFVAPFALLNSTTNAYSATDRVVIEGIITCPQAISPAEINEAVHQCLNALSSASVKGGIANGFSLT